MGVGSKVAVGAEAGVIGVIAGDELVCTGAGVKITVGAKVARAGNGVVG